jgi:hypothetical protein
MFEEVVMEQLTSVATEEFPKPANLTHKKTRRREI